MPKSLMAQADFRRTLSRAMALPILVMGVMVGIALWQVENLLSATRSVDHTNQVIAQARLTQKQLTDMQGGLRGYYVTHDPHLLQRYTQAHTAFDTDVKVLERLIADNLSQQQRLAEIRADYARWFTVLGRTGSLPARAYLAQNGPNTEALRQHFDVFTTVEEELRNRRSVTAQQVATRVLVVTLGLALLLGLFLAYTNRRQLLSLSGSYERSLTLVQRQADALRASEEQLATTLRSIGDGVIATDAGGKVTFLNPVAERLTGWTPQEAEGKDLTEVFAIVNEESRQPVENPVTKALREGAVVGLANHTLLIARDGRETPIDNTGAPIRDDKGILTGVVLVFHDVTEKKRLENQLLQAQKLESVGRLAGGVAHDFNNLLTAILGYAELMEEEYALEARAHDYLNNITLAANKASNLTRQLLAFARRQVIEPKTVSLNELVLGLDMMLRRLIGENIELVTLPEDDLHPVKVDAGQFEQILVNLVVNSRDAMPDGGKITLETKNVTLDEEYARHHDEVVPGDYVMLAVSDTGSGMEEGIRLHIFEPFFTTKEKGRGTGLGLATVYGIVRQAGGHIWLYSEPGEGTTFKIYLPRSTDAAERAVPVSPGPTLLGGSETILLVEDEPAVRAIAVQALQQLGYAILEAMNGEEALRLVKGHENEVALLLTDVIMPQMSGKELADRLQSVNPTLKVLYASGYTENTIVHHGVLESGVTFLSKPFTPALLARKVREMLDRDETAR